MPWIEWPPVLFALLCPIAPGMQIGLFALNLLCSPKGCIPSNDVVPQEITKPEQGIRIWRSRDIVQVVCPGEFKKVMVTFWQERIRLATSSSNSARSVPMERGDHETGAIPQREVET